MSEGLSRLCLANLGGKDVNGRSGAEELFAEFLEDVLANIARLDTNATDPREISIKVKFKPNADRSVSSVEVSGGTKLAPLTSAHGRIMLGYVDGKHAAAPIEETMPLFEDQRPATPTVLPGNKVAAQ